ncbi:MAG: TonB family protein [Francisellaceae bacterium]
MISAVRIIFAVLASVGLNYAIFSSMFGKEKNVWEISQSQVVPQQISPMLLENMTVMVEETPKEVKKEKPKEVDKPKVPVKKKIEKQQEKKKEKKKVEKKVAQPITPPPVKSPPKIISKAKVKNAPPPLSYPDDAVKNNHYGNVKIKATIDQEGSVSSIQVISSSGYSSLDRAAVKWFQEIEFHPANNSEGAVSSTVTQTITFTLKE